MVASKTLEPSWFVPINASDSRVERRRSRRRGEILAMTARVLGERGYTNTSLDEVAERLDFAKASIYYYFDSKESLAHTMLSACHAYVVGRLKEIADLDESATQRLRGLITEMIGISTAELRPIIRLFLHPLDWPPDLASAVRAFREENDAVFQSVIEDGMTAGEFSAVNPTISRLCMQGAMSFVPDWYRPKGGDTQPIVETLMRLFVPPTASQ